MVYYKTFNNHPNQVTQFQGNDRVARIKDGKLGTFKWQSCPMNGHNDNAGSWAFEMDDGEEIYLNGYIYDSYPWRIPNRFRKLNPEELLGEVIGVDWAVAEAQKAGVGPDDAPIDFDYPPGAFAVTEPFNSAEDANARICDLVDMIVDDKAATEDYNYVVEQLQAMLVQ